MEIVNQVIRLTPLDHQTHHSIYFRLPKEISQFLVEFEYSPADDQSKKTKIAVLQELMDCGLVVHQNLIDKCLPVRNLITLSILLDDKYLGAHHAKELVQHLSFSSDESPLGFERMTRFDGLLHLSFDCHSIVSPEVVLKVSVRGVSDEL